MGPVGMGLPPAKRCPSVPDHFALLGEYAEYGASGKPTGWMRAAWVDPNDEEFPWSGRANITHLTRKLTTEELAALPARTSNGNVLVQA